MEVNLDKIQWPKHEGNMSIQHNLHKGYYESAEKAIGDEKDNPTYSREDFPDEEEIAKAIKANEVWSIQWYPNTPIGFRIVHAATLSCALEYALSQE